MRLELASAVRLAESIYIAYRTKHAERIQVAPIQTFILHSSTSYRSYYATMKIQWSIVRVRF